MTPIKKLSPLDKSNKKPISPSKNAFQTKKQESSSDSSSSDEEVISKTNKILTEKSPVSSQKKVAKASSSSESEEDTKKSFINEQPNKIKDLNTSKRKKSSSSSSESEEEQNQVSKSEFHSQKKIKVNTQPAAVNQSQIPSNQYGVASDSTKQRRGSSPFRRVKSENFVIDHRFKQSAEIAKQSLPSFKGVRGKQFRHEKTKKKRMSSFGGRVDTSVKSIKFDD